MQSQLGSDRKEVLGNHGHLQITLGPTNNQETVLLNQEGTSNIKTSTASSKTNKVNTKDNGKSSNVLTSLTTVAPTLSKNKNGKSQLTISSKNLKLKKKNGSSKSAKEGKESSNKDFTKEETTKGTMKSSMMIKSRTLRIVTRSIKKLRNNRCKIKAAGYLG